MFGSNTAFAAYYIFEEIKLHKIHMISVIKLYENASEFRILS